jgi:hypothetical protein
MRRLSLIIYQLSFSVALLLMAACSGDETEPASPDTDGYLTLRIATNTPAATRARTTEWNDANAQDEEMMNLWVVVVTNASDGSVLKCFACRPQTAAEKEIDDVARIIRGAYNIYSFANISVNNVFTLLGIAAPTTIPTIPADGSVVEITGIPATAKVTNAAAKTVSVNGNGFDPTAANNGFGETGIPMSNVQTVSITENEKDLIVVRMLAKMKITIKNETGSAATVQSLIISDITSNTANNNLKLLPAWTSATGKDNMAVVQHGDLQPNLNGTPATTDYVITVGEEVANDATITKTFYVNESATPTNAEGLFYLTLKMNNTEYRYAIIDQEASGDDDYGKWNYIARNDYRIIPIILDDYKLELVPYDFPPIGVYPVSVREIEDELYEMTFHDYGHFHLVPKVTKTTGPVSVPYGTPVGNGPHWTLNTDFAGSWKTAATKGGAWVADGNPNMNTDPNVATDDFFYRNQTATADADEAGGVPVWYANDGTAGPQWDPAGGTTYVPFIFGYIAEPPTEWWSTPAASRTDRQVYHEFRVKLYVGNEYRRDLPYRFYMTLSADQMLGARRGGACRRPHWQ